MIVKELLEVIQDDEMICIEDRTYETLEINSKRYLSIEYMERDVVCCYGERYKAFATIGTTIIIQ